MAALFKRPFGALGDDDEDDDFHEIAREESPIKKRKRWVTLTVSLMDLAN